MHERSLFKLAGVEPVRELRRVDVEPTAIGTLYLNCSEHFFNLGTVALRVYRRMRRVEQATDCGAWPRSRFGCMPATVSRTYVTRLGGVVRRVRVLSHSFETKMKIPLPLYPLGSRS